MPHGSSERAAPPETRGLQAGVSPHATPLIFLSRLQEPPSARLHLLSWFPQAYELGTLVPKCLNVTAPNDGPARHTVKGEWVVCFLQLRGWYMFGVVGPFRLELLLCDYRWGNGQSF